VHFFTIHPPVSSDRFRILSTARCCFHLYSFDLFGTIQAPWNPSACLDLDRPWQNERVVRWLAEGPDQTEVVTSLGEDGWEHEGWDPVVSAAELLEDY